MRSHLLRNAGITIAAIVLVFGAIPAAILGLSLVRAHDFLTSASSALRADDLDAARIRMERAVSAASSAETITRAPVLGALAGIFGLGDDLVGLRAIAQAMRDGAGAGAAVFDQGGVTDDTGDSFAAKVYDNGRIDLATVHRLEEAVSVAGGVLARSDATILAAPDPALGFVADALGRAHRELAGAGRTVDKAVSLLGLLPGFAGEDGARRYLLAFQSPSEARGGGGLIGVYGILSVTGGRLSLDHVGPIEELVAAQKGSVDAPEWFEDLYGGFRATKEFRMANMSPHFPTTAEIWLEMYRQTSGVSLDGVIALDPFALGELTAGTGPLKAVGWDRQIDKTNVRRVLLHDVYRHFDFKERIQNRYLRGLIDTFWNRLESPDLHVAATLRGVVEATRKQHIKLFSLDPEEERVLAELGAAGDYTTSGPSVQMLFNNNFAANKVDYFLHREIDTTVSLQEDGTAQVKVDITLSNDAPVETGSVLVRPLRDELPSGINDMILYLLMPQGATPSALTIDGTDTNVLTGAEGDYPIAWQLVDIEPQDSAHVLLSYRWPGAVDGEGSFELSLWPQAATRTDTYSVTVLAPDGFELSRARRGTSQAVTVRGRLRVPVALELQMVPAGR